MSIGKEEHPSIKEVWESNMEEEIKKISEIIDKYPYVSIDTEFPGIIYSVSSKEKESAYKTIKKNVDDLKLIQFGLTLSDEKGNLPSEISTWQFNMNFNVKKEKNSYESINLLSNSGICFEKLVEIGIPPEEFGSLLTTSGLVLNDDIKWISFHGSYDFAYLIKILTNLPLPDSEQGFFDILKIYFPLYFDIRHLTRNLEGFSKSLQKLALELDVSRVGTQHQAGSDSLVTSKVFHKITSLYINSDQLKADENVLFSLGSYYRDETANIFDSSNIFNNVNTLNSSVGNMSSVNNLNNVGSNLSNINNINSYSNNNNTQPTNFNNSNTKLQTQLDMNSYFHPQYGYIGNNYYRGNAGTFNYNYSQYNPNYGNFSIPNDYLMTGGLNNNVGGNIGNIGGNLSSNPGGINNLGISNVTNNVGTTSNNEDPKKRTFQN